MNNKGFMMAEVVVVASIVVVTLVGFYTSYNKIISLYNQRVDYYDVNTLYRLAKVRDESFYSLCDKFYSSVCFGGGDGSVIGVKSDENVHYLSVGKELSSIDAENQTFKEYLDYLAGSVKLFKGEKVNSSDGVNSYDGVLIMEKCSDSDKDNCKYAYLGVNFDASMS